MLIFRNINIVIDVWTALAYGINFCSARQAIEFLMNFRIPNLFTGIIVLESTIHVKIYPPPGLLISNIIVERIQFYLNDTAFITTNLMPILGLCS